VKVTPVTVTKTDISTTTIQTTKTAVFVSTSGVTTTIYENTSASNPAIVTTKYTLESDEQWTTLPIYVGEGQILHIYWNVIEGNYIHITFTSPSGVMWYIDSAGNISTFPALGALVQGSEVLSPTWIYQAFDDTQAPVDLGIGYFMFYLQSGYDRVVSEITYWIEG
jgi:hypothetical protein